MSAARVKLGIIGCGSATRDCHLPALAKVPDIEVVALCDVDQRALATSLPGSPVRRLTDWRALLELPDLDAVAVATPPATHADIGCAALATGKFLFLEKPLAADREGCERLANAGGPDGGRALLGLHLRWHRLVQAACALVREGRLGQLRAIVSVYTHARRGTDGPAWRARRAEGGGVLLEEGIHHLDLWRHLLDRDIEDLAVHRADAPGAEDATCTLSARLSGSVLGSAVLALGTGAACEVEIIGEQAQLSLSLYRFDGLHLTPSGEIAGGLPSRLRALAAAVLGVPSALARPGGDGRAAYQAMWSHFAACVRQRARPGCTLDDGRAAMAALFTALERPR